MPTLEPYPVIFVSDGFRFRPNRVPAASCSAGLERRVVRLDRLISGRRIGDDGADRHLAGGGQLHLGIADTEDTVGVDQDASGLKAAGGVRKAYGGAITADIRNRERNRLAVGVRRSPGALP